MGKRMGSGQENGVKRMGSGLALRHFQNREWGHVSEQGSRECLKSGDSLPISELLAVPWRKNWRKRNGGPSATYFELFSVFVAVQHGEIPNPLR